MGKLLFWFIVIVTVMFVVRLISHNANKPRAPSPRSDRARGTAASTGDAPDMTQAEAMVRCQHCGIHLPRSEAFLSNGRTWCGPEHARLGENKP